MRAEPTRRRHTSSAAHIDDPTLALVAELSTESNKQLLLPSYITSPETWIPLGRALALDTRASFSASVLVCLPEAVRPSYTRTCLVGGGGGRGGGGGEGSGGGGGTCIVAAAIVHNFALCIGSSRNVSLSRGCVSAIPCSVDSPCRHCTLSDSTHAAGWVPCCPVQSSP